MATSASLTAKSVLMLGSFLLAPFLFLGLGILNQIEFVGVLLVMLCFLLLVVHFEIGFLVLVGFRSSLDFLKQGGEGGMNVAGMVSIVFIVLGLFYILYRRVNILTFEDSKPFLAFLAIAGLSITYSADVKESIMDWIRLLSIFFVYLVSRLLLTNEEKMRRALIAILCSCLIPLAFAYYQLITGHGTVLDGDQERIVGTFLHPNAFASYLLIILIFCLFQLLEKTYFVPSLFLKLLSFAVFGAFIFTLSRGAWLVFILSVITMGILRYHRLLKTLPVLLLLAVFFIPSVQKRITNVVDPGYRNGRSAWDWRVDTWREISPLIEKKPILGHGLSTVAAHFGVLTHNDYLRLLAETGLVGLASYVFLMYMLLVNTWRDFRLARSAISKSFQVGVIAMIVGFMMREFADNTLRNTVVMMYFWMFVAIARNIQLLDLSKQFSQPVSEERNLNGEKSISN